MAIELKIDGEKPTPIQEANLRRIQGTGALAMYATPSSWPAQYERLKLMAEAS